MNFVPNTEQEKREMLDYLGIGSIADLFNDIDSRMLLSKDLDLPQPMSEIEIKRHMKEMASSCDDVNDYSCFLGAGCYNHFIPAVVTHLAQRGEFLSSYTPYQAEMSQGMLQSIFEFQSMMCELTGMEVANASMYDGASAMAEAAFMTAKFTERKCVVVSECVHPEYRLVLLTYANAFGLDVKNVNFTNGITDLEGLKSIVDDDTACVISQSPNFLGAIEDQKSIGEIAHSKGALFISTVLEPISLGLLRPPGDLGADIVVGEGQALGNPLNFGGPHLGFMTTKRELLKKIPGRISGLTVDKNGDSGFILTLQTREQHVRRERATSNICTNQAQNALVATVYMALVGKNGFKEIAEMCAQRARYAQKRIVGIEGFESANSALFFNEFSVKCPKSPNGINDELLKRKIIGGLELGRFFDDLKDIMMFSVTEMNPRFEIDALIEALTEVMK
jgi:glycine dehydrogenase subunit 1